MLKLVETRRGDKTYSYWRLSVSMSMTDLDVVEHAQEVSGGLGRIYNKKVESDRKPQFLWQIYRQDEAYTLMLAVLPYMGKRRSEDIREAIASWLSIKPKRSKTKCPQGHEFTPENTFVDGSGYRRCRQCNRDRSKRRGAK